MAKSDSSTAWMSLWMRRGFIACLLSPLSLLFWIVVLLRRTAYRIGLVKSNRLPVPVIVAGNIFIGGTGKTPLTIWLVEILRNAGFNPGVVSRGYGGASTAPGLVSDTSMPEEVGDEPLLIAANARCPVMVGRDRSAAACALLAAHPEVDVVISDDGLQYYAMERDIEIVLFDDRGAGNGWMLPAGPLREPVSRRRDFTIINGRALPAVSDRVYTEPLFLMQLVGNKAEQLQDRSRQILLKDLPEIVSGWEARIIAAAGIGNPARFFETLRLAQLSFSEMALPDHFAFASNPFADIDADIILITEKDAVKCARIKEFAHDPRIWVVPVKAEIIDEFEQQIVEKCRECKFA